MTTLCWNHWNLLSTRLQVRLLAMETGKNIGTAWQRYRCAKPQLERLWPKPGMWQRAVGALYSPMSFNPNFLHSQPHLWVLKNICMPAKLPNHVPIPRFQRSARPFKPKSPLPKSYEAPSVSTWETFEKPFFLLVKKDWWSLNFKRKR